MSEKPRILVVGSVNMDLVVRTTHMPQPGETVLGDKCVMSPGGKGANQAVAAARLGADVTFLGRVGDDPFAQALLESLQAEDIHCEHVLSTPRTSSGVAMIVVDAHGENSIVVAQGANAMVCPDDLYARSELFEQADMILLQLELPLPTVRAAIDLARRNHARVIFDPAPARRDLPDAVCTVDVISPNITEAEILTNRKASEERIEKMAAMDLIARGAKAAVLKLGARGALVVDAEGHFARVQPFKVEVVDTTAAGDAFTAALAIGLAQGRKLRHAARLANAAGALACTKLGAQSAMPTESEVRFLMADQEEM